MNLISLYQLKFICNNKNIMQQKIDDIASTHLSSSLPFTIPQANLNPVVNIQHQLYTRYSSSQHYFYTNKITQIVKQKCVPVNIIFQDIQCFLDEEEYLKRHYFTHEYSRKLSTFKQYYFYHQDCPRLFGNRSIAQAYEKWHERKRDFVYKKLKFMYNETYSSMDSSDKSIDQGPKQALNVSHFLLQISEYNPYSKKYYLRVQVKQEKEKLEREKLQKEKERNRKKGQNNQSHEIYLGLNRQLSQMLGKIVNEISNLVLETEEEENKKRKILKLPEKTRKTVIKLNFGKKDPKEYILPQEVQNLKISKSRQYQSKRSIQISNKQTAKDTQGSSSPKKARQKKLLPDANKLDFQLNNNLQKAVLTNANWGAKTKSIMLMSSIGHSNKNYQSANQKGKLIKIAQNKPPFLKKDDGTLQKQRRIPNLGTFETVIGNSKQIRSYKSQQRFDRNRNTNNDIRIINNEPNGLRISKSEGKMVLRFSPIKKNINYEPIPNLIERRFSQRQSKKQNMNYEDLKVYEELFSDRKLLNRPLISYKSQRIEPYNSNAFSVKHSTIKGQFGLKLYPAGRDKFHPQEFIPAKEKSSRNDKLRQSDKSQRKKNLKIDFKNGGTNIKLVPYK